VKFTCLECNGKGKIRRQAKLYVGKKLTEVLQEYEAECGVCFGTGKTTLPGCAQER